MDNVISTTPWFSGDEKPLKDRIGPYQRDYSDSQDGSNIKWCWWNGFFFGYPSFSFHSCKLNFETQGYSTMQNLPWRGVMK